MSIRERVARLAVQVAMKKPAPNRIPLSGLDRLKPRDYHTVNLGEAGEFLVQEISETGFQGLWFNPNESGGFDASVPSTSLNTLNVLIVQYYGELQLSYHSPEKFLLWKALGVPCALLIIERVQRFFYNKKKLHRAERMSLLRQIIEKSLEQSDYNFAAGDIMTILYGPRWASHPGYEPLYRYYSLLLESLVQSDDLTSQNGVLRLSPRAFATISDYEEDERRHRDARRQQYVLGLLTFALVIIGAIQALAAWYSKL